MKRILFVVGSLRRGGAEKQLVMIASELASRGFDVHVFAFEKTGDFVKELENGNVEVHDGGYRSSTYKIIRILLLIKCLLKLFYLRILVRPQLIQGWLPMANIFAAFVARVTFVTKISISKRGIDASRNNKVLDLLIAIADWMADEIIVNSQAIADLHNRDLRKKIKLMYNGINLNEVRHRIEAENTIFFRLIIVANLIPYKGHRDLIKALAIFSTKYQNWQLSVVGEDRGELSELKRITEDLGLQDRIVFLGKRMDIATLLSSNDIYISSSHEEGFPNSVLEALAAGLEVVATDVGGCREMLDNGNFGKLVPPRNPERLSQELEKVVSEFNEEKSRKRRYASIQRVESNYSDRAMVENYLSKNIEQEN